MSGLGGIEDYGFSSDADVSSHEELYSSVIEETILSNQELNHTPKSNQPHRQQDKAKASTQDGITFCSFLCNQ